MKRLICGCLGALGALLVALPWAPTAAAAEGGGGAVQVAVAEASGRRPAERAPVGDRSTDTRDYTAREAAAAPELGAFEGGEVGIYIGSTAVIIVLLVVIVLILL